MLTKRETEEYYFERYRSNHGVPTGVITFGDKPDVVIEGARRIGIEITNFYLQDGALLESEQIQTRLRQRTIDEARDLYLTSGGNQDAEFIFSFEKRFPIRDVSSLSSKIAQLTVRLSECEAGKIRREDFKEIPELSFIYLYKGPFWNPAKWRLSQLHSPGLMDTVRLQQIVKDKDKLCQQYDFCDEYWLLIIVDGLDSAQEQEIRISGINLTAKNLQTVTIFNSFEGHRVIFAREPGSDVLAYRP